MSNKKSLIDICIEYKNRFFFSLCLFIHIIYLTVFSHFHILPLIILNAISALFYTGIVVFRQDNKELSTVIAYFEVFVYSFIIEVYLGEEFGFFLFMLALISIIHYLSPYNRKVLFIIQFIGVMLVLALKLLIHNTDIAPMFYSHDLAGISKYIFTTNLCITLFSSLYASVVYARDLANAKEALSYSAFHDNLTGLYNRHYFHQHVKQSISENNTKYTIAMLDIDDFKSINDTYGHDAGDKVLEFFSDQLKCDLSPEDIVARWGGEEFVIYYHNKSLEETLPILEKLRHNTESSVLIYKQNLIKLTITIGVCSSNSSDESSYFNIINKADDNLYIGKNSGKNRIVS